MFGTEIFLLIFSEIYNLKCFYNLLNKQVINRKIQSRRAVIVVFVMNPCGGGGASGWWSVSRRTTPAPHL